MYSDNYINGQFGSDFKVVKELIDNISDLNNNK
jgi:hypothetical protein